MDLPFGRDEFFAVFARYNDALWPAPPIGLFTRDSSCGYAPALG